MADLGVDATHGAGWVDHLDALRAVEGTSGRTRWTGDRSSRIDATPDRVFLAFTDEISLWWQPSALFRFTKGQPGSLTFVPGDDGRLVETKPDGTEFVVGEVGCGIRRIAWC